MWIKKNPHCRAIASYILKREDRYLVVGVLAAAAALLAGLIGALGVRVEPLHYLLSMLATTLFGLTTIARHLLSEKSIQDMSDDELLVFVQNSDPLNDWETIALDATEEFVSRKDRRLRFRICYDDDGVHLRNFRESWANQHPDPCAVSYYCHLYYDQHVVRRWILVSVDGGRALLPIPNIHTRQVDQLDYRVATIVDDQSKVDNYLQRSRLSVKQHGKSRTIRDL